MMNIIIRAKTANTGKRNYKVPIFKTLIFSFVKTVSNSEKENDSRNDTEFLDHGISAKCLIFPCKNKSEITTLYQKFTKTNFRVFSCFSRKEI